MKKYLKESLVVAAISKKQLTPEGGAAILSESSDYKFSSGDKVYIAHGQHSGNFGKFVEETEGGYARVDAGEAGKFFDVPLIFLQKSTQ